MRTKTVLVHNPHFNFGERETKVIKKKLNGEKIRFQALKKINQNEDEKNRRRKNEQQEKTVGFTKLKKYKEKAKDTSSTAKDKKEVVLRVDIPTETKGYTECKAYKKKKFLYKIAGYLPVGIRGNEFVAVIKLRLLPIIILLFLMIGMLAGFTMCDAQNEPQDLWNPIIQDFTGQEEEESITATTAPEVTIKGFTVIAVDKDTGVARVNLENVDGNPCLMKFKIFTDSGILLYESDFVPPDNKITKITMNTVLEGKHKGYVFVQPYEIETGRKMNSMNIENIDIIFN